MDLTNVIWSVLKISLVMVLVFLNGFFVASEFAIVKVRDTQLDALIAKGHRRARVARKLVDNLDAYLSATQLGITLASLGLGWIGEPVFMTLLEPVMTWFNIQSPHLRHSIAFVIGFSVITFLHIVVGELAPKSLAIQKSLPTSLWVASPLIWFYRLFYPFIWVLNHTALSLLRWIGLDSSSESEHTHSEEELRLLFTAAQKKSGVSPLGRDIVLNALDIHHRVVREVMRPRPEIVALDTQASITECLDVAEKTRYSRFPLCEEGDLDKTLGVIHIKDLFAMRLKARIGADLAGAMRKIIYVPETARLVRLLSLFLERRLHFAIVVDEYGGTVGMVTIENVIEELVGQIQDEFDQENPLLQQKDGSNWELAGALPLHELSELVGEPLLQEGITTTSGFVTQRLGGFPKAGDTLNLGTSTLQVLEMDGLKVARLKLTKPPSESIAGSESQVVDSSLPPGSGKG